MSGKDRCLAVAALCVILWYVASAGCLVGYLSTDICNGEVIPYTVVNGTVVPGTNTTNSSGWAVSVSAFKVCAGDKVNVSEVGWTNVTDNCMSADHVPYFYNTFLPENAFDGLKVTRIACFITLVSCLCIPLSFCCYCSDNSTVTSFATALLLIAMLVGLVSSVVIAAWGIPFFNRFDVYYPGTGTGPIYFLNLPLAWMNCHHSSKLLIVFGALPGLVLLFGMCLCRKTVQDSRRTETIVLPSNNKSETAPILPRGKYETITRYTDSDGNVIQRSETYYSS
eukprot:m.20087 g.20087  ORF g.20087 m.20087 type:complete len:281 (+) comp8115_c0_seq1:33-875(+)